MEYTVKELAELAGVSTRTLRYYDSIGLLPASRADRNNEERRYDRAALLRLQQILFSVHASRPPSHGCMRT